MSHRFTEAFKAHAFDVISACLSFRPRQWMSRGIDVMYPTEWAELCVMLDALVHGKVVTVSLRYSRHGKWHLQDETCETLNAEASAVITELHRKLTPVLEAANKENVTPW